MLKKVRAVTTALFFLTCSATAQGHYDVSANAAALFTTTASGNGISQSATIGSNYFGTFRVRFKPRHSIAFNYGRAKNSQVYEPAFDIHVLTNITEYSGAYIYTPLKTGRFEPFVLAGGGALVFNPRSTWLFLADFANNVPDRIPIDVGTVSQTEIAFLYGAGVDMRLPKFSRLALRLQYRGFLYNAPDFKVNGVNGSSLSFFTGAKANMAEPSLGLVFRF